MIFAAHIQKERPALSGSTNLASGRLLTPSYLARCLAGIHSSVETIGHTPHVGSRPGKFQGRTSDRQDERHTYHDQHTKTTEGGK